MKTIYRIKLPVLLSHLGLTKCVIYLRYAHTSAFYASLTSVNHLTFKSLAGILQTNCGWLQNLLILPVCWRRAGLLTVMLSTTVRLEDKPSMYKHWGPGIVPHPKSQGCNIHPSFHPSIPLSFHPSTHLSIPSHRGVFRETLPHCQGGEKLSRIHVPMMSLRNKMGGLMLLIYHLVVI